MNLKVKFESFDNKASTAIYVYEYSEAGMHNFTIENGEIIETLIPGSKHGMIKKEDIKPFLVLSGLIAVSFKKAMADALSEIGFDGKNYEGVRAKLDAVQYHLEDMRKLVFK